MICVSISWFFWHCLPSLNTVNRCCVHYSFMTCIHVCQFTVFYRADEQKLLYATMASNSKKRLKPSDILSMLTTKNLYKSLQILMRVNCLTQIKIATVILT